jgi:hypothetical protein
MDVRDYFEQIFISSAFKGHQILFFRHISGFIAIKKAEFHVNFKNIQNSYIILVAKCIYNKLFQITGLEKWIKNFRTTSMVHLVKFTFLKFTVFITKDPA